MKKISFIIVFTAMVLGFLVYGKVSLAKTDLSIAETDISFSKSDLLDSDSVRIYARVFNIGDNDVSGFVTFSADGREITSPQPISIKPNTYDDVFVDWKVSFGTYNIEAKVVGSNPADDNTENNKTTKKNVFVDKDTDKDGVGDSKDSDIDGDGLTNEEEKNNGTNPLLADTDVDKVNDKIDAFPLNKAEWRDTDLDGTGDNSDPDIDGDTISNQDETIEYGTNPLNPDSDNDGLLDNQEIQAGTNPNKADTDGDGTNDSTDKSPLDPSIATASLAGSLSNLLNGQSSPYIIFGIPAILLILLLMFRRKKE